jgi:hypothetical protein
MKELLYFSSSDVMIQVIYKQEANSLDYYSHRKLTFGERVVVEQYLLNNIAVKTEYYKKHPSMLNYVGVNSDLVKELNQFHLKNTINVLKAKEKEVEHSVKKLIDKSMSNYYFEQIGNAIVDIRQSLQDETTGDRLKELAMRIESLITAYNAYSDNQVHLAEIVPSEFLNRLM